MPEERKHDGEVSETVKKILEHCEVRPGDLYVEDGTVVLGPDGNPAKPFVSDPSVKVEEEEPNDLGTFGSPSAIERMNFQ